MTLDSALAQLKEASDGLRGLSIFVFGSVLRDPATARDFDVLTVYDDVQELETFKTALAQCEFEWPLHHIAMTPAEQASYRFISNYEAVPLDSL